MSVAMTMPPADVRRLFDYEDGRLLWKECRGPRAEAGKPAGYAKPLCHVVNISRRTYTRAELVIAWHTGTFPIHHAYHLNGNPFDDRIENLADMSHQSRSAVRSKRLKRFPGITQTRNGKRWQVYIAQTYIGTYDTQEQASEAFKHAHVAKYGDASPYSKTGDV